MAAMFIWCVIGIAACLIGMLCCIPGWIARKIRDRRELHMIRTIYPNVASRRVV